MSPEEQAKIKKEIGVMCSLEMHGCIKCEEGKILRRFIKGHKPSQIVESGSGVSTFFILKALQELGKGKLISVDKYAFDKKPDYQANDFIKRKEWIFPVIEKYFFDVDWLFIDNVDSVEYLKTMHNDIDFFFHDSNHTIEHIDNELELVKDRIKWYGAHNFKNSLSKSYFNNLEFKKKWRLIGMENQVAIWEKSTEGQGVNYAKKH